LPDLFGDAAPYGLIDPAIFGAGVTDVATDLLRAAIFEQAPEGARAALI